MEALGSIYRRLRRPVCKICDPQCRGLPAGGSGLTTAGAANNGRRRRLPAVGDHRRPATTRERPVDMRDYVRRSSTLSGTHNNLVLHKEILGFIKSSFSELEGQNYRWLNKTDQNRDSFDQDGCFLVLVNAYMDGCTFGCRERIITFERVKSLQRRFPKLNVFGLQCGTQVNSIAAQTQIIKTVMEEYFTFPILISDKDFLEMTNTVCYLLFNGSTDHVILRTLDVELEVLLKVIEELYLSRKDNVVICQNSNSDKTKQDMVIEEPSICSSFRNLLLYYPGCVSVDEDGERLFISDSNHHRIIVTDGEGKILDSIGSSPGFEDGEFESAKILRPAASFYNTAENCLYFVDSENHAVRRADMERRVLETVYPVCYRKTGGMWNWFLDKLGLAEDVKEPEASNLDTLNFPWHLIKLGEDDLLIINRSFEMSWIMSMSSGEIKEVLRGSSSILEICEQIITEKVSLLKDIEGSWSQQSLDNTFSLGKLAYVGLMSSVAKFNKNVVFCDSAGQRVLKWDRKSRSISCIQFSAMGVLGLPYWMACPLERVSNSGSPWNEHLHYHKLLPGRCEIKVIVDIPKGTELVVPLEEGSIWRQARGSAAELSGFEQVAKSTEKVGIAQQWFDELDNLAFSTPEMKSSLQDESRLVDARFQDKEKVHFDCAVNISPGTSEIVVSLVLYLKLQKAHHTWEEHQVAARRVLDLPKTNRGKPEDDTVVQLILQSYGGDLRGITFMKPLHLRIKLECDDHPTALTTKETIIIDSTFEINVSLD